MNLPAGAITASSDDLDPLVGEIESRLAALGSALRDHDAAAIETQAQKLQRALASAVLRFGQAAHRPGGVPTALRRRLAAASGQVAAQRECLARATAALDRAIEVLIPAEADAPAALYRAGGQTGRASQAAHISA